jgi:hypothetical protein
MMDIRPPVGNGFQRLLLKLKKHDFVVAVRLPIWKTEFSS